MYTNSADMNKTNKRPPTHNISINKLFIRVFGFLFFTFCYFYYLVRLKKKN